MRNKCNEKNMKQIGKLLNFAGIFAVAAGETLMKFSAMKMRLRTTTQFLNGELSSSERETLKHKMFSLVFLCIKLRDKFDN